MDLWLTLELDRLGFIVAGIAYLFFLGLVLATRTSNLQKTLLLTFTLATLGWAGYYAWTGSVPFTSALSLLFESTRTLFLLLFLLAALSRQVVSWREFFRHPLVLAIVIALPLWSWLGYQRYLDWHYIFTGYLAICIIQLALLETLYRRASQAERWQFKPLVLALTIGIIFDFVLLAESALFGRIDDQLWLARGYVFTALVPLLIISLRRIQAWGITVYISRDIVLQSSLVMAAGLYLCLLAIAGFYIRFIGGDWTNLIQATFIGLGFAILAVLLLSGAVRRKFKVFIEKHFFANKFDYREKWLSLTTGLKQIDLRQPEQYQRILAIWLNSIGYDRGAIVMFKADGQPQTLALQQRSELNTAELKLIKDYQQQFATKYWLLDTNDQQDSFVVSQPYLSECDVHLLIPVHSKGQLWGLCLMNAPQINKISLNWELRDYLTLVSEQVSSLLLLMQASKTLSENAQFVAFSQMSAFVVHDLKNVKAQIDLILKNAQRHAANPEFIQDTFDTLAAMQNRMQHMLSQLGSKRVSQQQHSQFSVAAVAEQVIKQRCANRLPVPELKVIEDARLVIDKERFASVLYHLLDNAQQACQPDDKVCLTVSTEHDKVIISISDTGCGMSADFIAERLFKPFDSTKGNAGMGIGAYDAKHFAEQSGGSLSVNSIPTKGTTFSLILPLNLPVRQDSPALTAVQGL
ncbi:XrtA/PEP-CTERM system histidine kinase PrsK [Arsukibacterium sp.]|uniref:XrtA/PEP-CTERM system histidine kinase PrsK n=1 Tax=Arsukibacterium sp. TaxID=1977258 RepID=UPI002FD89CDB